MDVKHGLELYEEVGKDLKFLSASSVRTKVLIGLNGVPVAWEILGKSWIWKHRQYPVH